MNNWDSVMNNKSVMDAVTSLTRRIARLEEENIGLTNELYELQNRLDMIQNNKRTVEIPETAEGAYIEMIKKGYTMTADGFWMPPDRHIEKIQLDGLTGELYITIPDEFIEKLGWKEDDQLEWIAHDNGTLELRKV